MMKEEILRKLAILRAQTGPKRTATVRMIEEMIDFVRDLPNEPESEEIYEPTAENQENVRKVHRILQVEPIMIGSLIGTERCRCERCDSTVDKFDQYCRRCGSMFGATLVCNNTKWDAGANRPA